LKALSTLLFVLIAVSLSAETDQEKIYRLGLPGVYGRMDGMVYFSVNLRNDGTYIFTESDCFTKDPRKGTWHVHGDAVVLDRKEAEFRSFRIYAVSNPRSLALLPIEEVDPRKGEADEERLFTLHKEGNG
jgi:hypothetical protein